MLDTITIRLAIAAICAGAAIVLLLWILIGWALRQIRHEERYGGYSAYTARDKRHRSHRAGKQTAFPSAFPRHDRPIASSRRYGRGYQSAAPSRRHRRIKRRKYGKFEYHGHSEASSRTDRTRGGS